VPWFVLFQPFRHGSREKHWTKLDGQVHLSKVGSRAIEDDSSKIHIINGRRQPRFMLTGKRGKRCKKMDSRFWNLKSSRRLISTVLHRVYNAWNFLPIFNMITNGFIGTFGHHFVNCVKSENLIWGYRFARI